VLRNKFTGPGKPYGETDPAKLTKLEEFYAKSRLAELADRPIRGRFDYEHRKAIHRRIFQDVYEWAGQERVAPVGEFMTKAGPDVVHYLVGEPAAPQVPPLQLPSNRPRHAPRVSRPARSEASDLVRDHFSQAKSVP
jgi:cell filamentation protein